MGWARSWPAGMVTAGSGRAAERSGEERGESEGHPWERCMQLPLRALSWLGFPDASNHHPLHSI